MRTTLWLCIKGRAGELGGRRLPGAGELETSYLAHLPHKLLHLNNVRLCKLLQTSRQDIFAEFFGSSKQFLSLNLWPCCRIGLLLSNHKKSGFPFISLRECLVQLKVSYKIRYLI